MSNEGWYDFLVSTSKVDFIVIESTGQLLMQIEQPVQESSNAKIGYTFLRLPIPFFFISMQEKGQTSAQMLQAMQVV